jgi:hypothetical protein
MRNIPLHALIAASVLAVSAAVPSRVHAADGLVFLDAAPVVVRLSHGYVAHTTVFLQNNTDSARTPEFLVQALDGRGPVRFEVSTPDAQPLEPRAVRAFRLNIFTTSKERQGERTNLSSSGYLVARAEGSPAVSAAVTPISFYTEPDALIGARKFAVPFIIAFVVIVCAGLRLWRSRHIRPGALMREVSFDPKQSWVSNFVVGASILNGVIGIGTLDEKLQAEVTALTGLFALLILVGPLFYGLTVRSRTTDQNAGPVWAFLGACGFTLMGGYGALVTALLVFDYFRQAYLVSEPVYRFFQLLIVLLLGILSLYALSTIDRTVATQVAAPQEDGLERAGGAAKRSSLL